MITPTTPASGRRPGPPRRYDWDKVEVGEWQNWISPQAGESITDAEARRRFVNLRNSAREWAGRNGLFVETRRVNHGRFVDLRFTRIDSEA